jgi:ribosomal protein L16/L10AE
LEKTAARIPHGRVIFGIIMVKQEQAVRRER